MRVLVTLAIVVSMAACHSGRVRCDSHLVRINPVAAKGDDGSGVRDTASTEAAK
ncbi:MAG TPA: hypothetical protein VGM84_26025 [Steroidobacteraceae bacterium]|jgi:hypothetical protein